MAFASIGLGWLVAGRAGELPLENEALVAGELAIRPDRFDAYVGEQAASLSRKEFELLYQLAAAEGRVLEREDIYQRVWGYTMARGDRSVDVFVRKLRQKLRAASPTWSYIHTHFGVGYRFAPAEDEAEHGELHAVPDKDRVGTGSPADGAEEHHTADLVA